MEMVVDRLGTRSSSEKIDVATQLSLPMTVEDMRVLLGIYGYLQKVIPEYRMVFTPISDLLRDPTFRTKKAGEQNCRGCMSRKGLPRPTRTPEINIHGHPPFLLSTRPFDYTLTLARRGRGQCSHKRDIV